MLRALTTYTYGMVSIEAVNNTFKKILKTVNNVICLNNNKLTLELMGSGLPIKVWTIYLPDLSKTNSRILYNG